MAELSEKYYSKQTSLIEKNSDSQYTINNAKSQLDSVVKNHWEMPGTSSELFTYEPFKNDPRDVAFAEIYNKNDEIRKYPCKQIVLLEQDNGLKHDPNEQEATMLEVPKEYVP